MKIGITEKGDAGRNLSWTKKIQQINGVILITKNIDNLEFQKAALKYSNKSIVHATITGFGGTYLEPNVSPWQITIKALQNFINIGFPPEQIVLRIDPIIPTEIGLNNVQAILDNAPQEIKRVRFSFMDNYKHIQIRGLNLPWNSFHAPYDNLKMGIELLKRYKNKFKIESCGEDSNLIPVDWKVGCVSTYDCYLLGIEPSSLTIGKQRGSCRCLAIKTELLTTRSPCINKCIYCYWKN